MRVRRYLLAIEKTNGILFNDIARSMVFFCILDFIFPILLDPLNLYNEFLGMEAEDLVEFIMFAMVPILMFCWSTEISGFGHLLGLIFYLCLSSSAFFLFIHFIWSDFMVIFIFLPTLIDMTYEHESDSPHDLDDLY